MKYVLHYSPSAIWHSAAVTDDGRVVQYDDVVTHDDNDPELNQILLKNHFQADPGLIYVATVSELRIIRSGPDQVNQDKWQEWGLSL